MNKLHKPIILCGFMANGKTAIGSLLSERLCVPFVDTDSLIAADANKSIPEIFADEGESGFREREYRIALKMASMEPCVVSTGGGMLTFDRNGEVLSRAGIIICLTRDFALSYDILKNDRTRPMVFGKTEEEVRALWAHRTALYKKYAAVVIDNSGEKEDCVDSILSYLKRTGGI